ncbi:hypothetical protein Btru_071743 [Bulinus truncatus]|nr:hypothetical protein Btru_071743 [Bulinus truncatus]
MILQNRLPIAISFMIVLIEDSYNSDEAVNCKRLLKDRCINILINATNARVILKRNKLPIIDCETNSSCTGIIHESINTTTHVTNSSGFFQIHLRIRIITENESLEGNWSIGKYEKIVFEENTAFNICSAEKDIKEIVEIKRCALSDAENKSANTQYSVDLNLTVTEVAFSDNEDLAISTKTIITSIVVSCIAAFILVIFSIWIYSNFYYKVCLYFTLRKKKAKINLQTEEYLNNDIYALDWNRRKRLQSYCHYSEIDRHSEVQIPNHLDMENDFKKYGKAYIARKEEIPSLERKGERISDVQRRESGLNIYESIT